ncbi:NADH dehydrogenase [ubiquinone] 1 alpha subcomplex subunit 8-like [Limulus polyphemus]|uniref:NADH dehydrogenase [ubiquinone] 1 alpha subcomplex subunit 8-like n=1 Tax=Limulus polyphemus TaxID=6850 RepID=A0ABM1B9I4_LIMPO|nr:NADH dehydrogenase [ubiquinone] 1 alpha subcomplex subunit 8-like [Limulus polyphemus]
MLCRREEKDPRKCLDEGKAVTSCALEFFRQVKKTCREPFEAYAHCLEYSSPEMAFKYCRKTQAALDNCMMDKMGLDRPELGYFSRPRVHKTQRPKPEPETLPKYPNQIPSLPDDFPREPAKHGSRWFFFN